MIERDIESWRRVSFGILHHYVRGWLRCRAEALLDRAEYCAPWLTPQTPDEQCGFCGLCGFGGSNLRLSNLRPEFHPFFGGTATAFGLERQRGWRGCSPLFSYPHKSAKSAE